MKIYKILLYLYLIVCVSAQNKNQAAEALPLTMIPVKHSRDIAIYDWDKRHEEVLQLGNKQPAADVVVIGDSIIHYWGGMPQAPFVRGQAAWDDLFRGKRVANLGFGWDRVENVLWRIQNGELLAHKPKIVFLMIGTNNLELNNATEIRQGIELICKIVSETLPDSTIHVIGILPRKPPSKAVTSAAQVNAQLHQHLSGRERLHFHDISQAFLDEKGDLLGALFSDGLHPNEKGYARFAEEISNIMAR